MSAIVAPSVGSRQRAWLRAAAHGVAALLRVERPREPFDDDFARVMAEAPQAVPRLPIPRDAAFRHLVVAALILHAALILAFLWPDATPAAAPREISVELVSAVPQRPAPKQVPKPNVPPPAPKPSPSKSAARRTPPRPEPARAPDKPSPMPVRVLPAAADDGGDAVAYPQLVLSKLARAKKEGRFVEVPGHAGVAFKLKDDGNLASVRLVSPSGDPSLDIEAVAMIKRAAPFPPPPLGGRRDYAITLVFSAHP